MKFSVRFYLLMQVLLQSCFAGVLLGQLLNLLQYQWLNSRWLYLTVGLYVAAVILLVSCREQCMRFVFRQLAFGWVFFSSAILYGLMLLLLLVPAYLGVGNGPTGWLLLQQSLILAIVLSLLQSQLLEWGVLQKISSELANKNESGSLANVLLSVVGVASFCLLSMFIFRQTTAGFQEISQVSIWLCSMLLFCLLLAKVMHYRWLINRKELEVPLPASAGRRVSAFTLLQNDYYYFESKLEQVLAEASPEERIIYYARIRQVPLVDQLPVLEKRAAQNLEQDVALDATILFLKKLKAALQQAGAEPDIDAMADQMVLKAYIRDLVAAGKPMLIQKLLHDNRPEIRKAAILASVHFRETAFIPVLVNLLKEPDYAFSAKEALYRIGRQCIPYLRSAKFRNKDNPFFLEQCLLLVLRFQGNEATDFLLEMLNEPQKRFRYKAALALLKNGHEFSGIHKTQLLQFVESLIALVAVQREIFLFLDDEHAELKQALAEEEDANLLLITSLLEAFLPKPVHLLLSRYARQGPQENSFTLYALIDLFFPLVLRNKCKLLYGSKRQENIARLLQAEYINEQVCYRYKHAAEAVEQVLRLDYGQIGYWLRVCALRQLGKLSQQQVSAQVLAEVFNENPLLQETAAEVLYTLSYDYYYLYMQRLSAERAQVLKQKIELNKTLEEVSLQAATKLLYQQVLLLKKLPFFKEYPYEYLARCVELFRQENISAEKHTLSPDPYRPNGYWVVGEGAFTIRCRGEKILKANTGDVVDLSFLAEADMHTVTITPKNLREVYFIEYSTLNNLYLSSQICQRAVIQPSFQDVVKAVLV